MKQSVLRSLSEKDTVLLLETKRKNTDTLGEDGLVELHQRVQRARNKHVKNYRRAGAGRVDKTGSRGGAAHTNQKNRDRAEVFEDALARVSRKLAVAARVSADKLRAERLAAARKHRSPGPTTGDDSGGGKGPADRHDDRRPFTPARKKRAAGTAAAGNRRQARKDNR